MPARKDISIFRKRIINWYRKNGRVYPWRETHDPFRILISEMMLRRTKADQVVPVYEQFFREYPDVDSLAEAKQEALEKILYPLGLKWRIPAFGMVARELREKYQSRIPETREELISLPGVGEYVAGTVLSIACGKKEWLVDSNIVRIFKRYFGIKTSKEGRRDKHVVEIAKTYASGKDPGRATMGILDITALVCKPGKPACEKCPLIDRCYYVLSQKRN
jgi:A/G-specific adenine glycosylase